MNTRDITLHFPDEQSKDLDIPADKNAIAMKNNLVTAFDVLLYSLSDTSKRQYRHTFDKWATFADDNGIRAWELSAQNVIAFIESENLAHSTKSARISHLRKLLQTLHAQQPDNVTIESYYKQVKLVKPRQNKETLDNERDKKALKPREIFEAFDVWQGDKLVNIRNRALLAVAFYAGLRRSEIAALTWDCIDYENATVFVKHGKGDKERTVPFASKDALQHIRDWQNAMTADYSQRKYIFCGIKNKGQGELRKDKPMHTNGIYDVMQKSGDFAPHDARRTIITSLLNAGASVSDVQFIAGHANPSTTLGYAQVKDAKEVSGRIEGKLPY